MKIIMYGENHLIRVVGLSPFKKNNNNNVRQTQWHKKIVKKKNECKIKLLNEIFHIST